MNKADLFNEVLVNASEEVDRLNRQFYGRYNYPWPPVLLPVFPEDIAYKLLNQDIGYWKHDRIPAHAKIWVAGCGRNQALLTALKFPQSEVLGTDISAQSLEACRKTADQIGVNNLQLEERSLNDIDLEEQFDYIICTGVIHHNADPAATLKNISRALKKNGVLELMVYNYYHRLFTTACQKAIRNFYDATTTIGLHQELDLANQLIRGFPYNSNPLMGDFLNAHAHMHEAEMADSLVQPVEFSYTIESLAELSDNCGLELLTHCQNQFDIKSGAFTWNMKFDNAELQEMYFGLPDRKRWQITNLLLCNYSPMLWFYLQRKESDFQRKTEQQLVKEFLDTRFIKNSFPVIHYILEESGRYQLQDKRVHYPSTDQLTDLELQKIYATVNSSLTMRAIFYQLRMKTGFNEVNKARIMLASSGYPFIVACND